MQEPAFTAPLFNFARALERFNICSAFLPATLLGQLVNIGVVAAKAVVI